MKTYLKIKVVSKTKKDITFIITKQVYVGKHFVPWQNDPYHYGQDYSACEFGNIKFISWAYPEALTFINIIYFRGTTVERNDQPLTIPKNMYSKVKLGILEYNLLMNAYEK